MLDKSIKMPLSELVDSVTFIKLETKAECFLPSNFGIRFTKDFIFCDNKVFQWNGRWKLNIGQRGRGPYEEVDGVTNVTSKDGKFYSKSYKLIEYDATGKPTKKVKNLWSENRDRNAVGSSLANANANIIPLRNYLFLSAADAVYFVNPENFQIVNRRIVVNNKATLDVVRNNSPGNTTSYRDNFLYCNRFNDTVFYVKDMILQPMWVINVGKDIKLPMEAYEKIVDYMNDWASGGTRIDEVRSGKVSISNVYETNNYLFIRALRFATSDRKISNYYICYNKKMKTSKVINSKDFVDDILGLGVYSLQIYDEKIFQTLWPHEIFDIIDKKKKAGEKIHPKLEALSRQINEGDNPVIFVAHLKK